MRVIGINGFKTSGKDTTYGLISRICSHKVVQRVAFADKLKIHSGLALGLERPDAEMIQLMDSMKDTAKLTVRYWDPTTKRDGIQRLTGRQYLQWVGGHARRVFGDTFWIDQVLPQSPDDLGARFVGVDIVCVTDVRYPNEAERVRSLGGEVWEVVRPGLTGDGHASEIALPRHLVTRTILNDSSLEVLQARVTEALEC